MRAQTKEKKRHFAILLGTTIAALATFTCGPLARNALAQTDTSAVIGSLAPDAQTVAVAGNDTGGTIPNSSYSGTAPAPAAAIPDHPAVDTPTPIPTPSPAVQPPPMPLGTNGMKPNASDMPLR